MIIHNVIKCVSDLSITKFQNFQPNPTCTWILFLNGSFWEREHQKKLLCSVTVQTQTNPKLQESECHKLGCECWKNGECNTSREIEFFKCPPGYTCCAVIKAEHLVNPFTEATGRRRQSTTEDPIYKRIIWANSSSIHSSSTIDNIDSSISLS